MTYTRRGMLYIFLFSLIGFGFFHCTMPEGDERPSCVDCQNAIQILCDSLKNVHCYPVNYPQEQQAVRDACRRADILIGYIAEWCYFGDYIDCPVCESLGLSSLILYDAELWFKERDGTADVDTFEVVYNLNGVQKSVKFKSGEYVVEKVTLSEGSKIEFRLFVNDENVVHDSAVFYTTFDREYAWGYARKIEAVKQGEESYYLKATDWD